MDDETKKVVILHIDTILEGKEAEALERITQVANHNKADEKTPSKVALGLLRHILSRMRETDNWVLGFTSIRKEP
jgi:hypothetical protein